VQLDFFFALLPGKMCHIQHNSNNSGNSMLHQATFGFNLISEREMGGVREMGRGENTRLSHPMTTFERYLMCVSFLYDDGLWLYGYFRYLLVTPFVNYTEPMCVCVYACTVTAAVIFV
jgi:hypothetical protein